MEKPKFTPGPWRVEKGTTLVWGWCNPEDNSSWGMGYPIAECRATPLSSLWSKGPTDDENEGNARLIAAAPDMYEALLAAEKLWQTGLMYTSAEEINRVNELRHCALSKANGEGGDQP